jgi:CRP/FNR family transcriptional regulator
MRKRPAATVIDISRMKVACKDCTLQSVCVFGQSAVELADAGDLVKRRQLLRKGDLLYRLGDPLQSLFAVRKGTLKTTGLMEDGRAQVTGFHLAGEVLGVDAINSARHPCSAEALEPTEVCEIPYAELETLAPQAHGLTQALMRMMSREIVRDEELVMMLGRMTAEERLASCLLNFSRRQAALGMPSTELRLAMSRQDLGDYLGLALETVSRLLSHMQGAGILGVHGRHLELHDLPRLESMACSPCDRKGPEAVQT